MRVGGFWLINVYLGLNNITRMLISEKKDGKWEGLLLKNLSALKWSNIGMRMDCLIHDLVWTFFNYSFK